MLVYCEHITPRVSWIFQQFFSFAGIKSTEITTDLDYFLGQNVPKISYSFHSVFNGMNIVPSGLLFENHIRNIDPEIEKWEDSFCFFRTSAEGDIPFDIFSASFYLLSRYEEYLPFEPDEHGRFRAEKSLLGKNKLLHLPLVDQWAGQFAKKIKRQFPGEKISEQHFSRQLTIDVDNAWAYLNKGSIRTTGSRLKNFLKGNHEENRKRKSVLGGKEKDPYDTYDYITRLAGNIPLSFFFLAGRYSKFDKNISCKNPAFRNLVKKLSAPFSVGVHPSYFSIKYPGKIHSEKKNLEEITGKPIDISRQHYLRMSIPETCRSLVKEGIKKDFSMVFARQTGFRAGTSRPFVFYDLRAEAALPLEIIPSPLMDASMRYYMNFSPEEAIAESKKIIDRIKEVNGHLCLHWHNESVSDSDVWAGWRKVFEFQLKYSQ